MENASKAIIIAGGILIALVLISLLVMLFNNIGDVYSAEGQALSEKQLQEYNKKFNNYNRSLYGSELLSLANLVEEYNQKLIDEENGEKGPLYEKNSIKVYVSFYKDIVGEQDENGKWIYETFHAGKKSLEEFKEYNDTIEANIKKETNPENCNKLKSALREIRSLPFVCISNEKVKEDYAKQGYNKLKEVQYNEYGRISEMYFIQD